MKTRMHFSGGQELAANLAKLSQRMNKNTTREALEIGARPVATTASLIAPRRPPQPDMADHIIVAPARVLSNETAAVKVGPDRQYGSHGFYVELGTIHMAAQPFMRPAFDGTWRESLRLVRDAFWTLLASVGVQRSVSAPSRPSAPDGGDLL